MKKYGKSAFKHKKPWYQRFRDSIAGSTTGQKIKNAGLAALISLAAVFSSGCSNARVDAFEQDKLPQYGYESEGDSYEDDYEDIEEEVQQPESGSEVEEEIKQPELDLGDKEEVGQPDLGSDVEEEIKQPDLGSDVEEEVETEQTEETQFSLAIKNAKKAITDGFNKFYMNMSVTSSDEVVRFYMAPNQSAYGSYEKNGRNCFDYMDTERNFRCYNDDGPILFKVNSNYKFDGSEVLLKYFETTEGLDLISGASDEGKYVFANTNGDTITITFDEEGINNAVIFVDDSQLNVERTQKISFDKVVEENVDLMRMINLFDGLKSNLQKSFSAKYYGVHAKYQMTDFGGSLSTEKGVFNGYNAASITDDGDSTTYHLATKDEQYECVLDQNGDVVDDYVYNDAPVKISDSFINFIMDQMSDGDYTMEFDESLGKYSISRVWVGTVPETWQKEIEIGFNADLSLDVKITHVEGLINDVYEYKFKNISIEEYNVIFLGINEICQQVKEQGSGITQ